jgi:hypothetical protein
MHFDRPAYAHVCMLLREGPLLVIDLWIGMKFVEAKEGFA